MKKKKTKGLPDTGGGKKGPCREERRVNVSYGRMLTAQNYLLVKTLFYRIWEKLFLAWVGCKQYFARGEGGLGDAWGCGYRSGHWLPFFELKRGVV